MIIFFNPLGLLWLILGIGCAVGLQNINVIVSPGGNFFLEIMAITILAFDFSTGFFWARKRAKK